MNINKHVSRGLCSSRLLHNPEIRAVNRGERKAQVILAQRKIDAKEAQRRSRQSEDSKADAESEKEITPRFTTVKDKANGILGRVKGFLGKLGL